MLKLHDRYHRRVLVLCALIAIAFIANRKVAILMSYAMVIGGNAQASHETFRSSGNEGAEAFPMGCKSLRVTADYSKLKLAMTSVPHFFVARTFHGWKDQELLVLVGPSLCSLKGLPLWDLAELRI